MVCVHVFLLGIQVLVQTTQPEVLPPGSSFIGGTVRCEGHHFGRILCDMGSGQMLATSHFLLAPKG